MKRIFKRIAKNFRIYSLLFVFFILFAVVLYRFYILQIEKNTNILSVQAQEILVRGKIFFQDKTGSRIIVAYNKDFPLIYAVPKEIKDPLGAASQLAQTLKIDEEYLKKILSKKDDQYEIVLRKSGKEQIEAVKKLNIQGIYTGEELMRYAPFGDLASQLLGFVGPSSEDEKLKGRYGAEAFYNNELSRGDIDLVLTIDRNIQTRSEEILKKLIERFSAKGGLIIIEEPKTGKILAMTSLPNFDINEYNKFSLESFSNPVTQAVYEPGSVLKVITMATGLDAQKLTPETTYIDTGSVKIADRLIENWDKRSYGKITMTQVLEHSVNTGAVFAQRLIGQDIFYNYLVKFGFKDKTGVDLPSEIKGNLNNLKKFSEVNFATASFGQGISVTSLELINSFAAIANGGLLMRPYLVDKEIFSDGEEKTTEPEVVRRVISEEVAKQVTQMMVSAVRAGKLAMIPSYEVAGKTGTAQVPDFSKGGYTNEVINTYVGFAPASNPRFVVLIKLDEPAGAPLSGVSVVPAFKELTQFILNYLEIPPDLVE